MHFFPCPISLQFWKWSQIAWCYNTLWNAVYFYMHAAACIQPIKNPPMSNVVYLLGVKKDKLNLECIESIALIFLVFKNKMNISNLYLHESCNCYALSHGLVHLHLTVLAVLWSMGRPTSKDLAQGHIGSVHQNGWNWRCLGTRLLFSSNWLLPEVCVNFCANNSCRIYCTFPPRKNQDLHLLSTLLK